MSHIEGLSQITANLQKAMTAEIAKMNGRVELAGEVLRNAVKAQAGLTDHSQAQLTAMGSPYSTRYDTDYGPHKDDTLVHIQTGTLQRSIQKVSDIGVAHSQVAVGVSRNDVPYIDELMYGSPLVRPRRFIQKAFDTQKPLIAEVLKGGVK